MSKKITNLFLVVNLLGHAGCKTDDTQRKSDEKAQQSSADSDLDQTLDLSNEEIAAIEAVEWQEIKSLMPVLQISPDGETANLVIRSISKPSEVSLLGRRSSTTHTNNNNNNNNSNYSNQNGPNSNQHNQSDRRQPPDRIVSTNVRETIDQATRKSSWVSSSMKDSEGSRYKTTTELTNEYSNLQKDSDVISLVHLSGRPEALQNHLEAIKSSYTNSGRLLESLILGDLTNDPKTKKALYSLMNSEMAPSNVYLSDLGKSIASQVALIELMNSAPMLETLVIEKGLTMSTPEIASHFMDAVEHASNLKFLGLYKAGVEYMSAENLSRLTSIINSKSGLVVSLEGIYVPASIKQDLQNNSLLSRKTAGLASLLKLPLVTIGGILSAGATLSGIPLLFSFAGAPIGMAVMTVGAKGTVVSLRSIARNIRKIRTATQNWPAAKREAFISLMTALNHQ